MSDTDEKRFRDADRFFDQNRDALEHLENARDELEKAKSKAEPHMKRRIEILRKEIGQVKTEINEERNKYRKMKAGAKHQIQTEDQDRHENRPDEQN